MPRARAGDVELEYELLGDGGRPLLLIGGLGGQLISWDDEFCELLVAAGYQVARYDNRDAGLSTGFDHLGVPDLLGLLTAGASAPYRLDDLAEDALGLLDHLGWRRAHLFGLSMGGMVAQLLVLSRPERVISVVAALSGPPGRPEVLPSEPVIEALLRPPAATPAGRIDAAVDLRRALAAGAPDFDEAGARRRAAAQVARAYRPAGTLRQGAAVLGTPSRLPQLGGIQAPVLLVHGDRDPLVPFTSALAAAAAIPGAELLPFPGLGHDLPEDVARAVVRRMESFHSGLPA